jgi:hypothetical protein
MQIIDLSNEEIPHDVRRGSIVTVKVRAEHSPNGDIEITRTRKDNRVVLTVIPKDKRAALANFLIQ